jgi:hypothetical protein
MTLIVEVDNKSVRIKNQVLDELMDKSHCLCCGEVLDGHIWYKECVAIAKPTFMKLEFCYFNCEAAHERIFECIRPIYNRKTKL